ncbi:short-chain dehydrogenase/reductase family protein [Heterostelium album PN500]|uniref:Short-chain dehydrogenase/reductase family protein n=1 Tax=Heterostelium pallidum (strain ATCC 26659 / Pp 5 / PN500) TaxID=670386 RepID=D3B9L8_HETP5|nr:short-chain dehydrogenase/reductase family protein [Heterostelium album PN500]EFA81930.1 short-chain dehydrogenase/reductase family protein [Heterostelium album PN500]|eukprot:XP_020434047.1 short-chain dehydrogenase/reductase family protein [Heterostelium album PN500]
MSSVEIKSTDKVWYITGASKGMGLIFVKKLLEYGFKVVGTSRDKQQLIDAVGSVGNSENFLAVKVELANEASVKASFEEVLSKFGRIDVVVNNAGYAVAGAVEENSDEEIRKNFDINVFGVFNVLRYVTPILRNQGSGHVFNISSVASMLGFPGFGVYNATKFALDGLTEAYALEVKPFGINVTGINPGYFKTEFLTSGSYQKTEKRIDSYAHVHGVVDTHANDINGNQRGDCAKLLDILIRAYEEKDNTTNHIFVGPDGYPLIRAKLDKYTADLDKWEKYATKTDRDDYVEPPAQQQH